MYQFNQIKIHIENKNGSMVPSLYSLLLAKNIPRLNSNTKVIDIGCGSGILGIVSYIKGSDDIIMTDISENSILDTINNCKLNKIPYKIVKSIFNDVVIINEPIKIIKSDLFKYIHTQVDLILCNPPSLPSNKSNKIEYYAGKDGRLFIEKLILNAPKVLKTNGKIIMTHTSLANINKTFKLLEELHYKYKIIDIMYLKFRDFYDVNHILSLNNNCNNLYPLYFKYGNNYYETVYVLEIILIQSKL